MGRHTLESALETALASAPAARLATLLIVSGAHVVLSTLAYRVRAARLPPGSARAALLLPIAAVLFALPLLAVDGSVDPLLAQSLCCMMSMSAFKVIALCAGRGTLADPELTGATSFLVVCMLPIVPVAGQVVTGWRGRVPAAREKLCGALANIAGFVVLATLSTAGIRAADNRLRDFTTTGAVGGANAGADGAAAGLVVVLAAHLVRALWYFGLGMALMCEVNGMGLMVDVVAMMLAGLQVEPHFNRVWLATSFSELWGRRWNLTVTQVLRPVCYDPFVEGHWLVDPTQQAGSAVKSSTLPDVVHAAADDTPPADRLLAPLGPYDSDCLKPGAVQYGINPDPNAPQPSEDDDGSDWATTTGQVTAVPYTFGAGLPAGQLTDVCEEVAFGGGAGGPGRGRGASDPWVSRSGSSVSSSVAVTTHSASVRPFAFAISPSTDTSSHSGSSSMVARSNSGGSSSITSATARIRSGSGCEEGGLAGGAVEQGAYAPGGGFSLQQQTLRRRRIAVGDHATDTPVQVSSSWDPSESAPLPPQSQQQQQLDSRPARPSKLRRFAGTQTTFLVSGLWHELVCYSMCGATSGGSWMLLFVIQAPILMVESQLKRHARRAGLRLPLVAARVLVHLLFFGQLMLMWYPPMTRTGMMASLTHTGDQVTAAVRAAATAATWGGAAAAMPVGSPREL